MTYPLSETDVLLEKVSGKSRAVSWAGLCRRSTLGQCTGTGLHNARFASSVDSNVATHQPWYAQPLTISKTFAARLHFVAS